jgi:hypothetical protein
VGVALPDANEPVTLQALKIVMRGADKEDQIAASAN